MKAVSIWDLDERRVLAIDLVHVLLLAGPDAESSVWSCSMVEALGAGAAQLESISDGPLTPGANLLQMARNVDQVINGEFRAYRNPGAAPWLVISAIESTEYAVVTDSDELIARLRVKFRDVRDSPGDLEL